MKLKNDQKFYLITESEDVHGGNLNEAKRRLGLKNLPDEIFDFSVNVNPYGPPEELKILISSLEYEDFIAYPEINSEKATLSIAKAHGIPFDSTILGNGSTELFYFALATIKPEKAIFLAPCYSGYAEICTSLGLKYEYTVVSSAESDFKSDFSNLKPLQNSIIFICNPNNPTGAITRKEKILELADNFKNSIIAVDESFSDFLFETQNESLISTNIPENIIIFKSFTKFFGIAGLRLGAIFADPTLCKKIRSKILPWNLNSLAQKGAPLLYSSSDYLCEIRKLNEENKKFFSTSLKSLGIKVFPSYTNFILTNFKNAEENFNFQREMLKRGFLIRDCSKLYGLNQSFARISILDKNLNNAFICAAQESLSAKTIKRPSKKKKKAIMIVGTSSDSGKSLLCAALCNIFSEKGVKTAPFKAQNMALNSYVTSDGGEIGRAQAFQAKCAGIEPECDMNPILLKPCGNKHSQVIANGKVFKNLSSAKEYYKLYPKVKKIAFDAYDRLSSKYDLIIIEGAGSPAEINLMHRDFVNMACAEYANADTYLVADIDRGGVFSQIFGTLKLIPRKWRKLIKGVFINKFRGDESLLTSGIEKIEKLCGVKVLAVLPYMKNIFIEEEDSLALDKKDKKHNDNSLIDIAVVRYPRISNYTDMLVFEKNPLCNIRYIESSEQLAKPDLLILPGTKNTRADLEWMKKNKLFEAIQNYKKNNGIVFGICGGFQMLGCEISDPTGREGRTGKTEGFAFLNIHTTIEKRKKLKQVNGIVKTDLPFCPQNTPFKGYEIHMGKTYGKIKNILSIGDSKKSEILAAISEDNIVFGTYIHGFFDSEKISSNIIKWLAEKSGKNLTPQIEDKLNNFDNFVKIFEKKIQNSLFSEIEAKYR